MNLTDKTALVTGAGRGFGWGIAVALARAGANVCVTDIREEDIARTLSDIKQEGNSASGSYLDVADREAFQTVVKDTQTRWGSLDILVHSAIYMPLIRFEHTSAESWQQQLDVALGGLYNGTRAVWDTMKEQGGGHIIGIASGSSVRGYKEEVAYCTAKHAQEGFIKALSLEAKPYNIALNTMGPGKPIKTTRLTWQELDNMSEQEKAQWVDPADLGRAFAWLASQPPSRFSGLRFDAGTITDTLDREGEGFAVTPEKVTMYTSDFVERQQWLSTYEEYS